MEQLPPGSNLTSHPYTLAICSTHLNPISTSTVFAQLLFAWPWPQVGGGQDDSRGAIMLPMLGADAECQAPTTLPAV